jgi:hypothetical protein
MLALAAVRGLPRVLDGGDRVGIKLGVVLHGVEADLVSVGVMHQGQDPADARPVHAGVILAQYRQPASEIVDRGLVGHADAEVVESRGRPGALGIEPQAQRRPAVEPLIAGFWQQGREQSRRVHAVFWTRMADDGLLDADIDLNWLIDTTSFLAAAETYLLITRMTGWNLDAYQAWLASTWTRLSTACGGGVPPIPPPAG